MDTRLPTEKISLDFLGKYTLTDRGNEYIMSAQDDLTKFIFLRAISNMETITVVDVLMEYFAVFGIPRKIRTDQGTNFTSNLMKIFTESLGITKIECTAYHPESNGSLERSHGTLKDCIKFHVNCERTNWDTYLHNTSIHTSTQFSPYKLMFGREPNLPYLNQDDEISYEDYFTITKNKLHELHHSAHENQLKRKKETQETFKKKRLAKFPYSPGDKALLDSSLVPLERGIPCFSKPFVGPYTVTNVKYPNVTLNINGEEKTYHSNKIKPYILPINLILMFSF